MKTLRAAVVIALLSACASLRPVVDQTRYFALSPRVQQEAPLNPLTIGLTHIELPDYLRNREMSWRSGDQEIHYAPNLQWAEPLDKMIARALAAELGAVLAPNYRRTEIQKEISISFTRFESDQSGQVTLDAIWTIRLNNGTFTRHETKISSPGPALLKDPAGAVAKLSNVLSQMSREIRNSAESP